MSLPNVWHHRRVADNAAKSCWICYKPSTSVLITPNNKDFFYICVGHLKDRGFILPDAEEVKAAEARKKKEELDREIEKVKKEYDERMQKRREKRKEKEKTDGKDKDLKEKEEEQDKKEEKAKDDKITELSKKQEQIPDDEGPRIYTLNKAFYQQRVDRIRNAEIAKRNRERLNNPTSFPSVPSGNP